MLPAGRVQGLGPPWKPEPEDPNEQNDHKEAKFSKNRYLNRNETKQLVKVHLVTRHRHSALLLMNPQQTQASLLDLTLPDHHVNQHGDEAHGDERERDHHRSRRRSVLPPAGLEVAGVDLDEEVLNFRVWVEAAEQMGPGLQAHGHLIVGPEG